VTANAQPLPAGKWEIRVLSDVFVRVGCAAAAGAAATSTSARAMDEMAAPRADRVSRDIAI
jgi:hypothetical protein